MRSRMAPTLGDNLAHLLRVIAFLCVMTFILSASAFAQNACTVTDPTGTPLNVRATPAGRLLPEVFYNGAQVIVFQTSRDTRGKAWALVGKPGGSPYGWVFRDYINYEAANVSSPPNTSAPTTAQSPSVQPGVGIGWVKSSDIECDLNNICSLKNNYAVKGCVNYESQFTVAPMGNRLANWLARWSPDTRVWSKARIITVIHTCHIAPRVKTFLLCYLSILTTFIRAGNFVLG